MKKKYLAAILAAAMLSGCSMPDVSFENANSSLFVKKEEKDAGGDLSGGEAVVSGKTEDGSLANGGQPNDSASLSDVNEGSGKKDASDGGSGVDANDGRLSGGDESNRSKDVSDGGDGADAKDENLSGGDDSKS
ncbi:MAG: lipoprotein, partial [Lachnospiraceae bacterium]|nr:lipoprotein [Lachnospiraceae bacterium]